MHRSPFLQLLLSRLREIQREPEVIFWVFIFPILLSIGLGLAFRNAPREPVPVGVLATGPGDEVARRLLTALADPTRFKASAIDPGEERDQLRLGKVEVVVSAIAGDKADDGFPSVEFHFDPTRPQSYVAREAVDDALQRAAGRKDLVSVTEVRRSEPGARYIDFLIPGLLGLNIMSGGLWGVGFALTEMRTKKLLKRLSATPMRRTDFLASIMTSRVLMSLIEMLLLLIVGYLLFGMLIKGSLLTIALIATLGGFSFASVGLVCASRARKIESITGLINLVMMPMFVMSGVFFSYERFPDWMLPFVRALPLTALNDALRATILEGASLYSQTGRLTVLLIWGVLSFLFALRWFRWT